jgi:MinD-like ATPase involved in chromosome partitioning or flagellar assembly
VTEPEVALVFTPEAWVEELHRHFCDHGGARVRSLVVEPRAALDEDYDVLVVGHRWVSLSRALVADVHARGRAVLGVFDREEPAGRRHLLDLEVDAVIESDAGSAAFAGVVADLARGRGDEPTPINAVATRTARLTAVGGPPGVGRTEIAIQLAVALHRRARTALIDADDVAPAVAQRLGLPIEPNLRTAIDAVEHGRDDVGANVFIDPRPGVHVVGGLPNPSGWAQVRPGEVLRVVDRLADELDLVVVDGVGLLEDIGPSARGRFAVARAMLAEADAVVGVCDASPVGIARFLRWYVDAEQFAAGVPTVVAVNRVPRSRFRRGELVEELQQNLPTVDVVLVPHDARVSAGAWSGELVGRGPFTRAIEDVAELVHAAPRREFTEHAAVDPRSILDKAS